MNASTPQRLGRRGIDVEEVSLLVIEDDQLIRDSLLDWLSSVIPQGDLVGEPSDRVPELTSAEPPDAIVVDLTSSGGDRIGLVYELSQAFPEAHLVALTMNGDDHAHRAIRAAGASASLPIWTLSQRLEPILRRLLNGQARPRWERN
jgi:DNA-binding NarL/FixJ family response regulator